MENIRVRFAPSPTGFVHVGSLRTALYNYLFARRHKGKIVLRIEDTDRNRYIEGAVQNLLEVMEWAGIKFDEGPGQEGDYGPYYQSQRLHIYKDKISELIEGGNAYPCFCSAERLERIRREQAEKQESIMYDGHCRGIPLEESKQRMDEESHVIRLKIPAGKTNVNDRIRGKVSFDNALIDDQILIKSDGYPTYHFANVVDDHLMQINHVIRGEEWLPSTPKHVILYKAFGWELPVFAHLPLLLNKDRSKLSKRQGDVAVEDYQKKGIVPQALLNFVALLGWSSGDDQEIFGKDELIESFSLERVNKSGAVFDLDKLYWMNGHYLRNMSEEAYVLEALNWLKKIGRDTGDETKNRSIVLSVRNHIDKFNELKEATDLFFSERLSYSKEAREWIRNDTSQAVFKTMLNHIDQYPQLRSDDFREMMKTVQKETGIKGKHLWMPVRAAITGLTSGPELPVVLSVTGKDRVKYLLRQATEE